MPTRSSELRGTPRRPCRGEVSVHQFHGDLRSQGELVDVSRGGVRLTLPHGLPCGALVRLNFPRQGRTPGDGGRMIIGRVVHVKIEAGRHVIGIAFGWDAAVAHRFAPSRRDPKARQTYRPFSSRLKSWMRAAWDRDRA